MDGKYETAVKALDAELQRDPNSLQAQYCRAAVEVEDGKLDDGINRLNKLLEQYPKYSFAYSERSRADFKAGNYENAVNDANIAISYRPDVARTYVRRAMANMLLHKPDSAIADLQTASKLAPNEDPIYLKVLTARALMDLHRDQEALPLLNECITHSSKDARPYFQRALCYAHMKDWAKATADADKALELSPNDMNTKILSASLLSANGHSAEARRQFQAILKTAPDATTVSSTADLGSDVPSVVDAAIACLAVGDNKLAKAILTRVEAHRPLDSQELFALAKAELAGKDLFRAAKLLNQCLSIEPTGVEPRLALNQALCSRQFASESSRSAKGRIETAAFRQGSKIGGIGYLVNAGPGMIPKDLV